MSVVRFSVIILFCRIVVGDVQGAFLYADGVTTTGGQFNNLAGYSPANLVNNGFTSPADTIDTRVDYIANGNNYATLSGITANYNLTFNFNELVDLSGMHVWNYVYRNGTGGSSSPNSGVNAYTLAFYSGADGTGSLLNTATGNLAKAVWDAVNPAQTIDFGVTNSGVRSVVLHVNSSHGGSSFSGMNELAFESPGATAGIVSFTTSTNLVTHGSTATLSWQVDSVTSLVIDNGLGSVLSQTTNGVGSLQIAPTNGYVTYTLTANGVARRSVTLIGLPSRDKLHVYLLIGQSNMQGAGTPFDPALDGPHPRVLQFGSRDGMESVFVQAEHPLTRLTSGGNVIGMGLEFARTLLESNSDPDVVFCLINHALGATAIQWWMPGAITTKGAPHYLYDEAIQRAQAAAPFGVIKGVLWHQGEYNSNEGNTNPLPEPTLYAQRLQSLVDNLRDDLGMPGLPFVCGKFVPRWTNSIGVVFEPGTLQHREIVEAALDDLRNRRFNTDCADNAGLIGREDQPIHFDAGSQRELGRRYARQMLGITSLAALPPQLSLGISGNQVGLRWPATHTGWSLQVQTNVLTSGLGTNWVVVPDSTTTNQMRLAIGATNATIFFRLQSP